MGDTPECSVFLKVKAQNKILHRCLLDSILRSSIEVNAGEFDTGDVPYIKEAAEELAKEGFLQIVVVRGPTWLKIRLTKEGRDLLTDDGKKVYRITEGKDANARIPVSIMRYLAHVSHPLKSLLFSNLSYLKRAISSDMVPLLTHNAPTCPGAYWYQYKDQEPEMEQVYPCEEGLLGIYRSDGELMPIFYDEDVRWAGPIPFPPNYKKEP